MLDHDPLELHVPGERQPLEPVVEGDEAAGPLGVVEVHGVDAEPARAAAWRSGPPSMRPMQVECTRWRSGHRWRHR